MLREALMCVLVQILGAAPDRARSNQDNAVRAEAMREAMSDIANIVTRAQQRYLMQSHRRLRWLHLYGWNVISYGIQDPFPCPLHCLQHKEEISPFRLQF